MKTNLIAKQLCRECESKLEHNVVGHVSPFPAHLSYSQGTLVNMKRGKNVESSKTFYKWKS